MTDSVKVPFAQKPTIFYNCLGLIKDAAFLPLSTLDLHTKYETQKQQKWRLKFLTLSNEIIRIVLLPKEHHQSLNLSTVCFSEQTPSLQDCRKMRHCSTAWTAGTLYHFKNTSASSLTKTHHSSSTNSYSDSSQNCQNQSSMTSKRAQRTVKAEL